MVVNGNVVDQHVIIVFSIGDVIIHLMILKYTRLNMFDLNIIILKKKIKLKVRKKMKKNNVKNNTIIKKKTIHTNREDKHYY